MIMGFTGKKGNGKSYLLAKEIVKTLLSNQKYHVKDELPIRKVMIMKTLGLRDAFYEEWQEYIEYFDNVEDVPNFRDCDVFCDDITLSLSARNWENLPLQVQDWLTGSERFGCHFFFTAVRFRRVVIDFRENTDVLYVVNKNIGSRRPTPTIPAPKYLWGIISKREVPDFEFTKDFFNEAEWTGGRISFLRKKFIDVYDHTNVRLRDGYPNFTVIKRMCVDKECPDYIRNGGAHMKVKHV